LQQGIAIIIGAAIFWQSQPAMKADWVGLPHHILQHVLHDRLPPFGFVPFLHDEYVEHGRAQWASSIAPYVVGERFHAVQYACGYWHSIYCGLWPSSASGSESECSASLHVLIMIFG
jgi:hypothetical protein